MIVVQLLRLALVVFLVVAFLGRNTWPRLFVLAKVNLFWIILAYVAITLLARALERRHGGGWWIRLLPGSWTCEDCGARNRPAQPECRNCGHPRPAPPWVCQVCETENSPDDVNCRRCTVPRGNA